MPAHHFFVDPADVGEGVVRLTGDEAHHAARVLRVRPGEPISVADGSGMVLDAVVTSVGASVEANVQARRTITRPRPLITLYQAVAKGDRVEIAIEKAVEIGVDSIVPFVAERTIVRWDEAKRDKAPQRWRSVALAAAKQSRSAWLTTVGPIAEGPEPQEDVVLVLDADARVRLRDALPANPPETIGIVVGPEGALTPGEIEALAETGAAIVTLGERILRSETAGFTAAALVAYAYGSLG